MYARHPGEVSCFRGDGQFGNLRIFVLSPQSGEGVEEGAFCGYGCGIFAFCDVRFKMGFWDFGDGGLGCFEVKEVPAFVRTRPFLLY